MLLSIIQKAEFLNTIKRKTRLPGAVPHQIGLFWLLVQKKMFWVNGGWGCWLEEQKDFCFGSKINCEKVFFFLFFFWGGGGSGDPIFFV